MKLIQRILLEIFRWPLVSLWALTGWRVSQDLPEDPKLIITGAPHTTSWDYLIFLMAALHQRRRPYVTAKKELFIPPFGWFVRLFGGIPIDRGRAANVVQQMVDRIAEHDGILIVFTPEGTRQYTSYWKTGFYYAAEKAQVRILCGAINYKEKIIYLDLLIEPSGDIEADFEKIKAYQAAHGHGLHPDKAGEVTLRPRDIERYKQRDSDESALGHDEEPSQSVTQN